MFASLNLVVGGIFGGNMQLTNQDIHLPLEGSCTGKVDTMLEDLPVTK